MKRLLITALSLLLFFASGCGGGAGFSLVYGDTLTDAALLVRRATALPLALEQAGLPSAGQALVYTRDGRMLDAAAAEVTLYGNGQVRVAGKDCGHIAGLVLNPPACRLTDAYRLSREALERGERLLFIYVDGLGWEGWQDGLEQGLTPRMSALPANLTVNSYPTITPVNYAAMVTGEPPALSGVDERSDHRLACPSLFDYASEQGLSTLILEGDIQIIQFAVAQTLHPDLDGDGDTDNEVFADALDAVQADYDLVFIHFHGLDDTEHAWGPLSAPARAKLAELDAMIGQLLDLWPGSVLITADHGQHAAEGKGEHGLFCAEDLFVPLLTR